MGQGHEDKRIRRAREQIEKALARQDLDLAIEALMALDKTSRQPFFTQVSPFFRRKLPDLQQAGAWARLHTLAARAEQEPRLLTHESDDAALAAARWPLFLASMRARDFVRAGRYWQSLVAGVTARAPGLARVLGAWIDGQGQIDPSCLADLDLDGLPAATAPCAGPARSRPRNTLPAPPESVEQVEDALCSLFATQPLSMVSETLRAWLAGAALPLAKALRTQAGSLATRELLLCASAGTSLAEAGQLLARLAAGAADDVAEGLLLATRLLMTAGTRESRRGEAEALEALVAALVTATEFEGVADVLAGDLARVPSLAAVALKVCQGVLSKAEALPDQRLFAVWALAMALNAPPREDDEEDLCNVPGPTWLQAATRALCKRGKALASSLDGLDAQVRDDLLDDLAFGQPVDLATDLIEAVWTDASEETRRSLAATIPALITIAEETTLERLASSRSSGQQAIIDRIAAIADAADPDLPFLGAGGLLLWRRLGPRALPYHAQLLPFALSQVRTPAQQREVVKDYLGGKADILAYLEAMRELGMCESESLVPLIDETCRLMVERFGEDRVALARGLAYAARFGAPWRHQRTLAHAYQRAVLAADDAEPTPDDRIAVRIMTTILGEQLASPRKKQADRGKKTTQRRKTREAKGQLKLPLDEKEP